MSNAMNTQPRRFALLSAACILALAAGAASAQSAGGGASSGGDDQDFKQPLRSKPRAARVRVEGQPQAQSQNKSFMTLRQSEGDDEYEVTVEGEKVTSAKVNGKELPEKRIRRSDDKIELLDREGNVMSTFVVGKHGISTFQFPGSGGWQPSAQGGPQAITGWAQPKVMLGINMSPLPEEMADQLKLDSDEVVFIGRVLPDSPAEKAGLKDKDVVVAINGERPATREKVAAAIKDKDPGDDVAFTVVRSGKERTIKIELAKYDPKIMQSEFQGFSTVNPQDQDPEKMAEHFKELAKRQPQWRAGQNGQGNTWYFGPGEEGMRFYTPGQAVQGDSPELKARLKELDARMAELDKKMEALTARLEKLNNSLEQRRDRDR